jgi:hypothetical protein
MCWLYGTANPLLLLSLQGSNKKKNWNTIRRRIVKQTEKEEATKVDCKRFLLFLMPALALAAPAFAQVRPTTLSDSQEPGSVIVFPKFIQGTLALPEGGTAPITELEIGVACPKGVICPEHEAVKIRFHWVCGTTEATWPPVLSAKKPTSTSPVRYLRKLC